MVVDQPSTDYCCCCDWLYSFCGSRGRRGNVIVSVVKIAEKPEEKDNWFDLVFNLVAFIPVPGDGLKIVLSNYVQVKRWGLF